MVLSRIVKVGLVAVPVAAAAEVTRLTYKYPLRGPEPYHEIPKLNRQKATYVYTRIKLPPFVVALKPGDAAPPGPQSRDEGRQQAAEHAAKNTEHKAATKLSATPKGDVPVRLPSAPAPTALGMFTAAFWGSLPFVIEGWVAEHASPSAPPHWRGAPFDAPSFVGGMFTVAKRTATSLVVSYDLPPSALDAYVAAPSHGHQEIAAVPVGNDELEISYGDAHFMKGTAEDEGPIVIRIHHLYMRVVLEWARRRLERELAKVAGQR